ncbi:MAG: hypothetical protein ACYT04_34950 [Nostoc sp.]
MTHEDNYYIISYYNALPQEVAAILAGEHIDRLADGISSEEIIRRSL